LVTNQSIPNERRTKRCSLNVAQSFQLIKVEIEFLGDVSKNKDTGRSQYKKPHSYTDKKWGLFYPGHKPPPDGDDGKPLFFGTMTN